MFRSVEYFAKGKYKVNMKISFNKIWTYLNNKGISEKRFQEMTGFDDDTMKKLESNDDMLRLDIIDRICKCLNCTLRDIVDTK